MVQSALSCVVLIVLGFGLLLAAGMGAVAAPRLERLTVRVLGRVNYPSATADLRGRWRSTYGFRSKGRPAVGHQVMELAQLGKVVHGRYVNGPGPHRHYIRLVVQGDFATGTWRNVSRGARHHGVLQLKIAPGGTEMSGRWLGFDRGSAIQEGTWDWERL